MNSTSVRRHCPIMSLVLAMGACVFVQGQENNPEGNEESSAPPTIAERVKDLQKHEGLLTFYTDTRKGKVLLELPAAQGPRGLLGEYLYIEGLLQGLGSNPVGLDRGKLGPDRLVHFRHVGGRVLIEHINLRYRALSDNQDEQNAVRQSFATSVIWAGEIEIEDPDGRLLIDFTSFLVRDAHNVVTTLKRSGQGSYSLDEKRSVIDLVNCLAFPENLEFEAVLTFAGSEPGRDVRSTTPTPESISLVQHHSLVKLPDSNYRPRKHDPRVGCNAMRFLDYATPLGQPLEQRWINRHRLEKVDPRASQSRVKEPIIYYVDRGAPEAIRNALVEGGNWWAEAFEKAGFTDAYRVEVMPAGAHPLDVRYNMVQWVHRSTRGWSYGGSISDPRTGEIIKGHVSLGSLRVRQDILLFEGLAGVAKTGSGDPDDPVELALARIRQLSAHEIGHTLGFAHNFAASTYDGRASVMDYPAPLIGIENGELDFSDVYGVGIGSWDIHTVRYAYSQFKPNADEDEQLAKIVRDGLDAGYRFMSDSDARSLGSAHPLAHLWDNGDDPVEALNLSMRVRRIALDNFGADNIAPGQPLALLHETLVPVYLHHRFQLTAATKIIGGLHYNYALNGDGQDLSRPIDPALQRQALEAVLACIDPIELDLSDEILELVHPRPFGYSGNRELFGSSTSPAFDAVGAAQTAAHIAVRGLLHPDRCARLVDFHRRDDSMPSLEEVFATIIAASFGDSADSNSRIQELRFVIRNVVVVELINLAQNTNATISVRSRADEALNGLVMEFEGDPHVRALMDLIERYQRRELNSPLSPARALPVPPGDPIGMAPELMDDWCGWSRPG